MTDTLVKQIECERTFSQADFDAFARLSGDDNPVHVNPAFATKTQFGRTTCHGADGRLICAGEALVYVKDIALAS